MKRLYEVVGNRVVGDCQPGDRFEADLEPDHPWIVGGHVAPVALAKPKQQKEEPTE